jgi:hypothetical protein
LEAIFSFPHAGVFMNVAPMDNGFPSRAHNFLSYKRGGIWTFVRLLPLRDAIRGAPGPAQGLGDGVYSRPGTRDSGNAAGKTNNRESACTQLFSPSLPT